MDCMVIHGNGTPMRITYDVTADLKFGPCPIVGNHTSYSRNVLILNCIMICSQHSMAQRHSVVIWDFRK